MRKDSPANYEDDGENKRWTAHDPVPIVATPFSDYTAQQSGTDAAKNKTQRQNAHRQRH